jgi:hypothetical protein
MVELMGDKVGNDAVVIVFGMDNGTYYEENEAGDMQIIPKTG